jgi:hypothetical protein
MVAVTVRLEEQSKVFFWTALSWWTGWILAAAFSWLFTRERADG